MKKEKLKFQLIEENIYKIRIFDLEVGNREYEIIDIDN